MELTFAHPGGDKVKLSHGLHILERDNNRSICYKKGTAQLDLQCFRCKSKKSSEVRMKSALCLVLLLVATASAFEQCGKKGSGSRIINGVDAGHGEFPWQISLRFGRYGHICGGTLIGNVSKESPSGGAKRS